MRKYLLAAVAAAAITTPAIARDNSLYAGIEGGIMAPEDQDADVFLDFTTTQVPAAPPGPAGPLDFTFEDAFGVDYKMGYDIDAILGYDFGMFRVEGEVGYKRASLNELEVDSAFITSLNTALNRPSVAPDPGAPGLPALVATDFDLDGRVSAWSTMINGLVDFGDQDGLSFYAGGGFGRAWVKAAGERDSSWAWQLIAGIRYALSPNIDVGLKYRYFSTGNLDFSDDTGVAFAGNPNRVNVGTDIAPVFIDQTTNALAFADFEQKFRSHSLLASLIFNFGAPEPAPAYVPAAPPPPPPAAPATQTCPDGTVILATEICPAPPPPPPPPPQPGERG